MKTKKSQNGMTGITWLFVISLLLFFTYITILLVPIYLEYYNVKTVLGGLTDGNEEFLTSQKLRRVISKRLDINMANSVSPGDISITRDADVFIVEIEYEIRESFMGNIELLITFKADEEIPASDG